MAYETKDNTGKAFKNQHKSMNKHPEYTGDCKINGKMMRVAVYTTDPEGDVLLTKKKEDGTGGERYLSFTFSEPREEKMVSAGDAAPVVEPTVYKELDDDIPF